MRLSRCHSLIVVAGSLLLSGCFRPWTYPGYGYGYGSPAYGGYQDTKATAGIKGFRRFSLGSTTIQPLVELRRSRPVLMV